MTGNRCPVPRSWELTGTLTPSAAAAGGKNTVNSMSQPSSALLCLNLFTQPLNICIGGGRGQSSKVGSWAELRRVA